MNSDLFPLTYRYSRGWFLFLVGAGIPTTIMSFIGVWYFGTGHEVHDFAGRLIMVSICLVLGLLGLWSAIAPFYSKLLIIHENELQIPGLIWDKIVQREDIVGFRVRNAQGANFLQLETRVAKSKNKKVNISMLFKPDAAFSAWFEGIPNLDADDYAASLKNVENDRELGDSPVERKENIRRAKVISRVLYFVSLCLLGWLFFFPRPYWLPFLLVLALPWLVLWLCWKYKGSFTIEDNGKMTARPDLTGLLILPGAILALRALRDIQLVDARGLVVPAVIGLALMMICIVWVAPIYRRNVGKILLMPFILVAYPASAITIANALFDSRPAESHLVEVMNKHRTSGKGATQYFTVTPWGPYTAKNDVEVPNDLYREVAIGQTVCVVLHQGAFGLPWFVAAPKEFCRPN